MNTDGHHSGKAHSTHDITGSPTTHGSYAHSHKYSTHDITGSPTTHGSYAHSHKYSTHDITGSPTTHGSYAHNHKYIARVGTVTATDNTIRVYNTVTKIPHDTRSLDKGKRKRPQILQHGYTSYSHKNTIRY